MSTKKLYPSPLQKQLLIQLVEADPQLRSGKFSSAFTKKESERRWQEIGQKLNALNGANKNWDGWRKTWQDRKSNAKKKFSAVRRHAQMTGGGPPPKPPTEEDLLVLSTMPSTSLIGHSDCQESLVEFVDINFETTSVCEPATEAVEVTIPTDAIEVGIETIELGTEATEVAQVPSSIVADVPNEPQTKDITKKKGIKKIDRALQAAENLNMALQDKNTYKKKIMNNI